MATLLDALSTYPVYLALFLLLVNIACAVFNFDIRREVPYYFFRKAGFSGNKKDISIITNKTRFIFLALALLFAFRTHAYSTFPFTLEISIGLAPIFISAFLYVAPLIIFLGSFFHAIAVKDDTIFLIRIFPSLLTIKRDEVEVLGNSEGSWTIPVSTLLHKSKRYTLAISDVRSIISGAK